ncbi:hypothetical protein THAOC_33189, partial [Thalassiosira oceanica]
MDRTGQRQEGASSRRGTERPKVQADQVQADYPLYFDKLPDTSQTAFVEAMIDSPEDQSKNKALITSRGQKQYEFDKWKLGIAKAAAGFENTENALKGAKSQCVTLLPVLPAGVGSNPAQVACEAATATMIMTQQTVCSTADSIARLKTGVLLATKWATIIAESVTEGLEVDKMRTVEVGIEAVTPD